MAAVCHTLMVQHRVMVPKARQVRLGCRRGSAGARLPRPRFGLRLHRALRSALPGRAGGCSAVHALGGKRKFVFFPEPAVLSPFPAQEGLKCPVCKLLTSHSSALFRNVLATRGAWRSPPVSEADAPRRPLQKRRCARRHSGHLRRAAAAACPGSDGPVCQCWEGTFEMDKQVKMWRIYA